MRHLLSLVAATLAIAAVAGAAYLWRLRCEGFGCAGIGIAWAAWAGLL